MIIIIMEKMKLWKKIIIIAIVVSVACFGIVFYQFIDAPDWLSFK